MLAATAAALIWPAGSTLRTVADVHRQPDRRDARRRAGVLLRLRHCAAAATVAICCGSARSAWRPVASLLLVVGAGGGFGRVLDVAGVGAAIQGVASGLQLSPLLLGWVIAALLRIAVGSATVAIVTAAGIMAPVAAAVPGTNVELLVVALGAGSIVASHVNDGGFWLVKEYFNLSVVQTLGDVDRARDRRFRSSRCASC